MDISELNECMDALDMEDIPKQYHRAVNTCRKALAFVEDRIIDIRVAAHKEASHETSESGVPKDLL